MPGRLQAGGTGACWRRCVQYMFAFTVVFFLWMSLFPDVGENIDVWSFLLLGISQLGVCVWGEMWVYSALPTTPAPSLSTAFHPFNEAGRNSAWKKRRMELFHWLTVQYKEAATAYVLILMMSDLYLWLTLMNRMSGVQLMRKALLAELWKRFVCVSFCVGVWTATATTDYGCSTPPQGSDSLPVSFLPSLLTETFLFPCAVLNCFKMSIVCLSIQQSRRNPDFLSFWVQTCV